MATFAKAKAKKYAIDWAKHPPVIAPKQGCGLTTLDTITLESLVPLIDWNPFFQTWELRGRYPNRGYPKIFNDEAKATGTCGYFGSDNRTTTTLDAWNKVSDGHFCTGIGASELFGSSGAFRTPIMLSVSFIYTIRMVYIYTS